MHKFSIILRSGWGRNKLFPCLLLSPPNCINSRANQTGFTVKLHPMVQIIQLIHEEKFKRFLKCPLRFVENAQWTSRLGLAREIKYECGSIGAELDAFNWVCQHHLNYVNIQTGLLNVSWRKTLAWKISEDRSLKNAEGVLQIIFFCTFASCAECSSAIS